MTGPGRDAEADPDGTAARDAARAAAVVDTVLTGLDARLETVLGVPAVRIGDRLVARVLDGAFLLAPSDAVIPPPPEGVAAETVRPWPGAQPHLRIPLAALAPADSEAPSPAEPSPADPSPADPSPAAAWIRAAVLATAARVPAVRLPEPPVRIPHPRRPRT
ncbi:hypothetical protein QFZ62_000463 [Clavibacter sp. B3I6]|uniref:hypothetical protein n=1 Tax=Clavibacter sp. B3I6 TaxID=3042268 RepID=UPI002787B2E9|nr:hypothetical protein [Clavibacter sp. B3I6]MDQ0743155.1 hypothetical protein [Clavibacter sp. B3I6]